MPIITAVVESVIFNKDNFFILKTDAGNIKCSIFDYCSDNHDLSGLQCSFTGEWESSKYGRIFIAESAKIQTSEIIYFLTKTVKNIGEKLANELVERYGDAELEKILDEEPDRLLEVKGIKEKKLLKIAESWERHKHLRELSKFTSEYGISPALTTKIHNRFGNDAVSTISENPYRIADVSGIGFPTADNIALKMGIDRYSIERISACCDYILSEEAVVNGHTFINLDHCIRLMQDLLKIEIGRSVMQELRHYNNKLHFSSIGATPIIGTKKHHDYENHIYSYIEKNAAIDLNYFDKEDVRRFITEHEKESGIEFSNKQKYAIFYACTKKIFSMTGYAGTGKSSVSKVFMSILNKLYPEQIVGCALSGIAARRLSEVSGYPAYTIHSLLKFSGQGFEYNKDNRLPYKVVVLDEAGMVNIEVFHALISALADDAIFIIIGDDAQLPPIGAGNVFADIINNNLTTTIKLDKVFRQNDESVINVFAQEVRKGKIPENCNHNFKDWEYVDCTDKNYWSKRNSASSDAEKQQIRDDVNRNIFEHIAEIVKKLSNNIDNILTDFQILTPMHKSILGTKSLNELCQEILNNPEQKSANEKMVTRKGDVYCVGDKVVHTSNKDMKTLSGSSISAEDTKIYNGTLGVITNINHDDETVYVEMNTGVVVVYDFIHIGDILELAYTLTVHKAQGSEFKTVIIPLTASHYTMLDNRWFYTAITRAKSKLIMVAEDYAMRRSCTNITKKERHTWLRLVTMRKVA